MSFRTEWKKLLALVVLFAAAYWLPMNWARFQSAVGEAGHMLREYARQHVLLCLVPAFFIAGGISVFLSQGSVMKYLGAGARKLVAYPVASVSGGVLAVCSCTVLPLFSGIYRMGAGLGPATTFLYSGPAINVLAIVLTAGVLGWELGLARAVGAVVFSVVIGLGMHVLFLRSERQRQTTNAQAFAAGGEPSRPLWKNAALLLAMIAVLVFANWAASGNVRAVFLCCPGGLETYQVEGQKVAETDSAIVVVDSAGHEHEIPKEQLQQVERVERSGLNAAVHQARWWIAGAAGLLLAAMLLKWVGRGEAKEWVSSTWDFAKQILPLLFIGVLVAGLLLGRPGHDGLIPSGWIEQAVGGNSLRANAVASVAGSLMYFATLTEVPIVQGLLGAGMGKGPALALLLAGPAVSLPNLLVIRSVMGTKKTAVYVALVVVMATLTGLIYGTFF